MPTKKKARKKTTVDPLDEALNSSDKLAAQRRADDHALWATWKKDPTEENMHNLMRRFEPVFKQKAIQYKAPNVNPAAFNANLKVHAVTAFQTFDPSKAALRTHLETNLKRSMRYNIQQQNLAFIPEGQVGYIGAVDRANDELFEILGRTPSHVEVASFINERPELLGNKKPLTAKTVNRLQSNRRRDIVGSSMESDPTGFFTDRNRQIQGLMYQELTADEQQVFNHLYGENGASKITSTTALGAKLGKSPSQISRLKSSIADKYKKYL